MRTESLTVSSVMAVSEAKLYWPFGGACGTQWNGTDTWYIQVIHILHVDPKLLVSVVYASENFEPIIAQVSMVIFTREMINKNKTAKKIMSHPILILM
jgi:hypothetical protein